MARTKRNQRRQSHITTEAFHRLLSVADQDWEGMMRFGRYCGLVLAECASLRHSDFSRNYEVLCPRRWSDDGSIGMSLGPNFVFYLRGLPAPTFADAPLFPASSRKSISTLESEFESLAMKAELPLEERCLGFSAIYFSFDRVVR